MRLDPLAFALALALPLAACGGSVVNEKASTAADQAAPAPPEKVGDATIEMISTGEAPRRPLRYSFASVHRDSMTMEMKMRIQLSVGDRHAPAVDIPPVRMMITLDPKPVLPNGDLLYAFSLASIDLVDDPSSKAPPEMISKIRPDLQKLAGAHGEVEVTTRGVAVKAAMDAPPGVGDEVRDMIDQTTNAMKDLCSPLPSQAVGRGARWKATSPIHINGIEATRAVDFDLDGLDGDRATFHISVAMTAKPQVVANKRLPAGTTLTLDSLSAKGQGKLAVDLGGIVPTSDAELESVGDMTVKAGAEEQDMSVATHMTIQVRPTAR
jgi:hypothetical protein